jgi:2-oxoglutarate ferredoxin oxidoreductase subunit alpha
MREFIDGSEVVARAAINSGCNFFSGYPITPATSILLHMLKELPKIGGTAIQAEDEISAMGFCIGAALSGAHVMTATSGPGISLYSESIGAAIMCEVPMVIVDCQRMGPATGGATTVAQGDIQFLRWGTSGGYPVIVLAPSSMADCYSLTQRAFELAEIFRSPVFLALDKDLVLTSSTVDTIEIKRQIMPVRACATINEKYLPFAVKNIQDTPLFSPFGGPNIVRMTASSHNEAGFLVKDPNTVNKLNDHLVAKIDHHKDKISMGKADLQPGSRILLISYGSPSQAMLEAVNSARACGKLVSSLIVQSLWPIPEKMILSCLEGIRQVYVIELNHGQYLREIERLVKQDQQVFGINRVDGELITTKEILEKTGLQ